MVIVRPFNTYGPRQSTRAVIPTIATQLLSGASKIRLGALQPTRDFVFVGDTAESFVRIAEAENVLGSVINVGTEREISIGDLAKLLMKITGKTAEIETEADRLRPAKSEVERLLADASLLKKLIGWSPETSLEKGLEITVEWLRSNLARFRPGQYSV